jgi:hypothetical protein
MGVSWKSCFALFFLLYSIDVFSAKGDTVRVSNVVDFVSPAPPYRWNQGCRPGGRVEGVTSHLVYKVFQTLGMTVEWVSGDTSYESTREETQKKYQLLQSGELDFLITVDDPAGDDRLVTLAGPFVGHRIMLITKKEGFKYSGDPESLKSFTGGVFYPLIKGSSIGKYIDTAELLVTHYSNGSEALNAVASGEVDYALDDYFVSKIWAHEHQQALLFYDTEVVADDHLSKQGVYLVTGKNSRYKNMLVEIDRLLAEYRRNGSIEHLRQIYLKQWLEHSCS